MIFRILWAFRRTSRGKKFGNEIADSMAISRSLFHTAIEEGGLRMHLVMLASLKDQGTSVIEARDVCLPILANGILLLEQRLGSLSEISKAKSIIFDLLEETQKKENNNSSLIES